jgi:MFS family permease
VTGPPVIWKRNLSVLVAGQLLAVSAMGIVLPLIPFFVRDLGVTDRASVERWSGLIFSGPFLAAALLAPVWGALGDRYGHRKMVIRAVIGLAVVNLALVFVQTPLQFCLLRFFQGAVTGFIPAALSITSASTPPDKLPGAMARLTASASAGRLIGPAVGGLLAGFLTFRQLFLVVGIVIAVAAVVVSVLLKEPPTTRAEKPATAAGNLRWAFGDARLRIALPGLLLAMVGISMVMPIFPLYVEDLLGGAGDPKVMTGVGFAVVAGFTLLQSAQIGWLARRVGLKILLVSSLAVSALALLLHVGLRSTASMLAVRALLGIGAAGIGPVLHTMISRAAPDGMRGGMAGYASSATILGFFVGPLVGGWLANHVGIDGVFRIAAGVTAACAVGAAIVARRVGRDRQLVPVAEEIPR